ncbi:MAG: hypothetical protein QOE22_544 [Candidatus Parcubacteria bacterium]|jgi:diadenosine tetraphosphate (Ap4A) HIT family hydrolase|nr:hypothetical protein [Candidatus Parcubacteria bacterium]
MSTLRPHSEYGEALKALKGQCAFCLPQEPFVIKDYLHWSWIFNKYPYWKYNTMLILKRHITSFSELSNQELQELRYAEGDIEARYIRSGIVGPESSFGTELLMFWRRRVDSPIKKSVEHLHLHIAPEFEGAWSSILHQDAWDIDMNLLKEDAV